MKAKQFLFPGTHPAGVEPPREAVQSRRAADEAAQGQGREAAD
jgi:hypothetical protein